MPKVSEKTATHGGDYGPVVDRCEAVDGFTANFVTFREDVDATALLKGLPGDQCHCPHWGYVISGRVTFRYDHGDEVYEAGDAWYAPPGHIPVGNEPGTVMVLWSPTEELRATEEAMARNMAAMEGAS